MDEFGDDVPQDSILLLESTWQSVIPSTKESTSSTQHVDLIEQFVQTTSRRTIGVQTDEAQKSVPSAAATKGLLGFLKKLEGDIVKELDGNIKEHAILEPYVRVAEYQQEPPTCLHDLAAFGESSFGGTSTRHKNLVVTSLSWSATGQTVAAAYGRFDVSGWCTDPGALTAWNLARGEINPSKPDVKIETDNCLMSCAFHPTHPALIAGGTFNGELYVWDLGAEHDLQKGRTDNLGEPRHRDPIIEIVWQPSMSEANKYGTKSMGYRLVTLGADGRVLVWTWHKLEAPVYGYALLWPQPGMERKVLWGGSCMAFQRSRAADNTAFVVGTEGGRIFRCWFDINDASIKDFAKSLPAADKPSEKLDLRSPIKEADYMAHAGVVLGIDFSPFQPDLFLSCSADGCVRLYSSLRQQPLLSLEPTGSYAHAVRWSPFRPLMFATCTGDGFVHIYDLAAPSTLIKPALSFDVTGSTSMPVYDLAFNHKRPDLLVTGDAGGMRVWRLVAGLVEVHKGEESTLRKLAAADDVAEFLSNQRARIV